MSEMVERVARAIWQSRESRFPGRVQRDPDYLDRANGVWQHVVDDARAAVEAMREPTMAQLAAGQKAWASDDLKRSSTLYHAMIDAALSRSVATGE